MGWTEALLIYGLTLVGCIAAEAPLPIRQIHEFDFGAGEIAVGGNDRQMIDAGRQHE